ncbi:MAG: oxygen-independent coproporphyrinogen III oxidase [Nitrospirae bacterium]|nr:oxygen-independent coproporphyrinogen III oxidase [Nitrospirota bacterium]
MTLTNLLLKKYSRPGPRYTSYPTAPHFSNLFGEKEWREELCRNQNSDRDLSLYFHIPFCDSLCYYCGCHMFATKRYSHAAEYVALLRKEISLIAGLAPSKKRVQQIHWGGGTPTFLQPSDIRNLFSSIQNEFLIAPGAEIACEVDPRELTRDHIAALKESGFNRMSLGVQDLDNQVQTSVNRVQPENIVYEVYGWMRNAGFKSINFDLMLGLPHQRVETFSRTLDKIISWSPDRLAIFSYAHLPNLLKHQKLIRVKDLPDFQTRLALRLLVIEKLNSAGYVNIGMDHYSKPNDDLVKARENQTLWRNFQGYSTHGESDLYGFGVSGISQTEEIYAQNVKEIDEYSKRIQQGRLATERGMNISLDDKIRREVIMRIMCGSEIDLPMLSQKWKIDFNDYFADALAELSKMEEDGLVEVSAENIRVTETGNLFLRNIAMPFDAYLEPHPSGNALYSQTL